MYIKVSSYIKKFIPKKFKNYAYNYSKQSYIIKF